MLHNIRSCGLLDACQKLLSFCCPFAVLSTARKCAPAQSPSPGWRDRWEGRRIEIIEGGRVFGSSTRVMHVGRKGVDIQEDVPVISPSDENITSESWTIEHKGEKLI